MKKCEMATTSLSVSEAFNKKNSKGKRKNKESKKEPKALTTKKKLKTLPKEYNSSKRSCSNSLVSPVPESTVPEAVWEIEYSEPVPDLYPELSDSLKMQESDTEHDERAKVCESRCDSEENVQCVPTSFDDNHLSQDSHNNPATSQQSQNDSQQSNSNNQTTLNNSKRKRKLAKPKKIRKGHDAYNVQDTIRENSKQLGQDQDTEKEGTWAQCSIPSCGKWRFLQSDVDPQELPERWICAMNENDDYNTCSVSQETFDSQEGNLDVMYTPYPSGAVVWAKMVGYPWWPAMMENDPDYGYYCVTSEDNVTPVSYHVVFFDKQVSRAWVNAACIRNFSCEDDPEDLGKITVRGKNYRRQLTTATLAARSATQMPLQTRLSEFGFAARYKGTIGDKAKKKERLSNLEVEELIDSETLPENNDVTSTEMSETVHETERIQKQDDETLVVPKEPEPPVPCVSTVETDSTEANSTDEKNIYKVTNTKPCETSVKNSSIKKSTETKVAKKRKSITEAQSAGKKRKMSKGVSNDLENRLTENSKQNEQEKENASAVMSFESWSSKAKQKNQDAIEGSKQPVKNAEEVQTNSEGRKGSGNSSILSTTSECQLGVPVQKPEGKKLKSISQDKTVEEDLTMKKQKIQIAKSNGEGSEVLIQNGECEHQRIPKMTGFALQRSAASTDVRVALDNDSLARKKKLPKLVKAAFKPPVATTGDNNGKARAKIPKLLKPNFVSPTLETKNVREEKMPKSVACSDAFEQKTDPKKKLSLKRKAQCKDQFSAASASKKAKEATSCQEDLQAEIDEIDYDIASIRKELRVSDTSDTSLPEEMITSSVVEQQISLSDSPEF